MPTPQKKRMCFPKPVTFSPSGLKKRLINLGCLGQAAPVIKLPSTNQDYIDYVSFHTPPAATMIGFTVGYVVLCILVHMRLHKYITMAQ